MEALAWKNRYGQDPWEVIHRRLSVSGALVAMPSGHPICKGLIEVRSGLRRIRTRARQDGRFYFCDLPEGVYDLAFKGIATPLPDEVRFQLMAYTTKSDQQVSSDEHEFELTVKYAAILNGWICVLHFAIRDQHIAEIIQWHKEVTHA